MLPSLQESLDGDEKELESSEDGGAADERRLEPPPSSHYCLYSYRGSRCGARPSPCLCPGAASHPGRRPGRPRTPSSLRAEGLGLTPSFRAPARDWRAWCRQASALQLAPASPQPLLVAVSFV